MPLFGHQKILHTLTGMGSAALAAAVPCLGKATKREGGGVEDRQTETERQVQRDKYREEQEQEQIVYCTSHQTFTI